MRVIVSGSREIEDYDFVKGVLDRQLGDFLDGSLVILTGAAQGVDKLAERWCDYNLVTYERYPADWDQHGKSAGLIRNSEMINAGNPDLLIVVWDGISKGTKDIISKARRAGIKTIVELY